MVKSLYMLSNLPPLLTQKNIKNLYFFSYWKSLKIPFFLIDEKSGLKSKIFSKIWNFPMFFFFSNIGRILIFAEFPVLAIYFKLVMFTFLIRSTISRVDKYFYPPQEKTEDSKHCGTCRQWQTNMWSAEEIDNTWIWYTRHQYTTILRKYSMSMYSIVYCMYSNFFESWKPQSLDNSQSWNWKNVRKSWKNLSKFWFWSEKSDLKSENLQKSECFCILEIFPTCYRRILEKSGKVLISGDISKRNWKSRKK